MPTYNRRNSSNNQETVWYPESDREFSLNLPQGGGERSKVEVIEKKIAAVVTDLENDPITVLAKYVLTQRQNDLRINPVRVVNQSKLTKLKQVQVIAMIRQLLLEEERSAANDHIEE